MGDEDRSGAGTTRPAPSSKVARVIDELDLAGLGGELAEAWRGAAGERASLRELETRFNVRVLEASLERAGARPLEGEAENLYRLLTAPDVAAGARTEAETQLRRQGVEVDALRGRFVSHQSIHTYLTEVRGVPPPDEAAAPTEQVGARRRAIQRLRNRLVAVAEDGLDGLRDGGELTLGAYDVAAGVSVHCRDCGATYDVATLLDRGGCDCEP